MKILVVTNFYPPHYLGGYELGCRDVVEGLRSLGHEVHVLTSTYGVDRPVEGDRVYRWLKTDYEQIAKGRDPAERLPDLVKKEFTNRRAFTRLGTMLKPDLVYLWNMKHISVSIARAAERMGYPVCYFVSDYWLSEWEQDSWQALRDRRPKRLSRRLVWNGLSFALERMGVLSEISLQLRHVQFCSGFLAEATRRAGKHAVEPEVIHWGVDTRTYREGKEGKNAKRLLFVGQLITIKGVHTAVEAFHIVKQRPGFEDATLTIAGGPDYGSQVARQIVALGLEKDVRLTGLIPRDRLPQLYREHGTLLFSSLWDEPFSITLLEAMASGMAVVGTRTGGSPEILVDGENALVFAKGDAQDCAAKVERLAIDRELFDRIRVNARHTVQSRHTIEDMVRKVDRSLKRVAGAG